MRLGIAVPEEHVTAPVLNAALEATTRLDEAMIAAGAPTLSAARHRVRWRPEPPGQEHFDHLHEVLRRGAGDCDDLAPWHCASLRATGKDPGAEAIVKRTGPKSWHAVVRRSSGKIDDPSAWLGMGPGVAPFVAGCVAPLPSVGSVGAYVVTPRLATMVMDDGYWKSRADLPENFLPWMHGAPTETPLDVAMAALHRAPLANQAIAGAAEGARALLASLDDASEESEFAQDYLAAVRDAHHGADWADLADVYGEGVADEVEHNVGKLWRGIARKAGKILKPAKRVVDSKVFMAAAPFIPGGGQIYMMSKGASSALDRKGNIIQRAKGFGTGMFRGGAEYLEHPIVKRGASMFGMSEMTDKAGMAAEMAAQALEHTPPIVRDAGAAPKLTKVPPPTPQALARAVASRSSRASRGARPPVELPANIREIVIRL
jgi:hypothetical protein